MKLEEWFKTQDYIIGLDIYKASANVKTRTLAQLSRGYNRRNMSVLITELRKIKNNKPVSLVRPAKTQKPSKKVISVPQLEAEQNHQKELSSKAYFKKIKYGELPPELKVRFRKLKDLFYDMCDLKFQLNDLPEESASTALEIIISIDSLDIQKSTIWKELEHWQEYKTKLPTVTKEDFNQLSDIELDRKRRNIKSSISKKNSRIKNWKLKITEISDNKLLLKIKQQITRTQETTHKDELNLRKIELLLNNRL